MMLPIRRKRKPKYYTGDEKEGVQTESSEVSRQRTTIVGCSCALARLPDVSEEDVDTNLDQRAVDSERCEDTNQCAYQCCQ